MKAFGLLILLGVFCLVAVEITLLVLAGGWINRAFEAQIGGSGWLLVLVYLAVMGVVGIKLAKWHAAKIPAGFFAGTAGRHVMGAVGGVLIALPGLLTDVAGLLLLLPPVQSLFSKLGSALLAVVVKRFLGKGLGGLAGGLGAMGGGMPFPGVKPRAPDDHVPGFGKNGRKPKTYEVRAEPDR